MALQSEVSPPLVGDPNKDTQIEGDTKSDDSSQSTDEEVDLEEGEILDSGEEEEKKDLSNSSLKEALDIKCLKSIEQLVNQAKVEIPPNVLNKNVSPHNSPLKRKRPPKYLDHSRFENGSDHEDGWYSPSHKHKSSSKFDDKPIDYRKELEAYRGTPPSSPDNSKHREKKRKRSSKKSKKSSKKTLKRKDGKSSKVATYMKDVLRSKICKFYKDGNCAKGADCNFSHANPQPYKKKELCKFYLSGHCNKGNDCIYMHDEFPCKFYHTGSECYAKEACRFSHAPLNEEMKRVLADYLNIDHLEDDYDRKRRRSPSPEREPKGPPPKRTCLLGSPPRHIREAEETKRWQEEMLMQQQNHPGFKIHLSPSRDSLSPPPFTKPNFYQETLPSTPSPQKRRLNSDAVNAPLSTSFPPQPPIAPADEFPLSNAIDPYPSRSPEGFMFDQDYRNLSAMNVKQEPPDNFGWHDVDDRIPHMKNEVMGPFIDPSQQDLDFASDVKFDETTQFSEMESSVDCSASPPNPSPQIVIKREFDEKENEEDNFAKESEDEDSIYDTMKSEDKATDDSSSAQEPLATPIFVPSHLPKKQQELFKRIYQHQRKNALVTDASDSSNSPKSYDNTEISVKEEVAEKHEAERSESLWYSSEDDEDDSIDPVMNVLKKLQKEPPTNTSVKVEPKPAESIMAMLNKVQQNTLEKKKSISETQPSDFFKNLFLGNISSSENMKLPGLNVPTVESNRRTLLPDPQPVIKKEPIVAPKDPRLKNRDPRTLGNAANLPRMNATEKPVSQASSQGLGTSTLSSTTTTVITESAKEDVPYRLHGIVTRAPNYTPYISATQSNPNLLKDPRLRKHLNLSQNKENGIDTKNEADSVKNPSKDVPPMPKLLLEYDKSLNINIFESKPASNSVPKSVTEIANVKPMLPKLTDPRMRRRDSQNSTGSSTPPHLTIVENTNKAPTSFENLTKLTLEKTWTPPVLEKAWIPPAETSWNVSVKEEADSDEDDPSRLEIDENPQSSSSTASIDAAAPPAITKKVKPTPPASHLPRAIADPRMAKLHNPLDSRRLRVTNSECSNKNVELKKTNSSPNENSSNASKIIPSDTSAVESESSKISKSIPKKASAKTDEKKKTIHRNRKSSMDYASPLNSCDDSNSNKSLSYNSYNQRPPRTATTFPVSDSSVSSNSTNSITPEAIPDFISDNSNLECDNSSDVNLKDMFKTIDPTASPFC